MYREVKLGSHTVPMVANAATVIRYRQIFKRDVLVLFNQTTQSDYTGEIAYVMAMQAAKEDFSKLNNDTFLEWAEQFDVLDLFSEDSSQEIVGLFLEQQKTLVKEKKKAAEQSGK